MLSNLNKACKKLSKSLSNLGEVYNKLIMKISKVRRSFVKFATSLENRLVISAKRTISFVKSSSGTENDTKINNVSSF